MIPYGHQEILQSDIDAVTEVLRSDFLTQGPVVPRFEESVAKYVGAKYAIAVNSATSALHIACLALGVGKKDFVWTSPISFVASANCALYCGAKVDFIDIDPDTFNLCVDKLSEKLVQAAAIGALPKVLVVVHMCGNPCDMPEIKLLSEKYGFKIIEDASHAIGASIESKMVGSCYWSDITVFSFHPVKIITSGEGGMALTNNDKLYNCMSLLRSHGITRNQKYFISKHVGSSNDDIGLKYPIWHYEQQMLGFNYRMTDIHAALGLSQLDRINAYIEKRNYLAEIYHESLSGMPLNFQRINSGSLSSYHLFVIRLTGSMSSRRDNIMTHLRAEKIGVNFHYYPIYLQPFYRDLGFSYGHCPESELYASSAITLPLFPGMTDDVIPKIAALLKLLLK